MPNMPKVIFCMTKYFLLASFQKVRRAGNGTNSTCVSARCALFGYVEGHVANFSSKHSTADKPLKHVKKQREPGRLRFL